MNNYINITNFNNEITNQSIFYIQAQSTENMFKILNILEEYIRYEEDIDNAIRAAAAHLNIDINSLTLEDKTTLRYKANMMRNENLFDFLKKF